MTTNLSTTKSCLPPGMPDVQITIERVAYGPGAVVGIGSILNNHTNEAASFLTMENARAGEHHDKPPIPTDIRSAFIRDAHNGKAARIQLEDTPGYAGIQIHPGSHPHDAIGCTMVGNTLSSIKVHGADGHTHAEPLLQGSQATMKKIMAVAHSKEHPVISVETGNLLGEQQVCEPSPSQPMQTPVPHRAAKRSSPVL